MSDELKFSSASDKDVYDLLISGGQRLSETAIRRVALQRGIIFSSHASKESIADHVSLLTHDYRSVRGLIDQRETMRRTERMTCIVLPIEISRQELENVVREYQAEVGESETITFQSRRSSDAYINVAYNDTDYSRTRLIQHQRRDAGIELIRENGTTVVRMPATDKAEEIVSNLTRHLRSTKQRNIEPFRIDITSLHPDLRTRFFMRLMREMPGYQIQTVINLKVFAKTENPQSSEIKDDLIEERDSFDRYAEEEFVGHASKIALSGQNLDQSEEYQALRRKGYYITSATWHAAQQDTPHDLFQFTVSFDSPAEGQGFKYGARIAKRLADGSYREEFHSIELNRQPSVWRLIERTAQDVYDDLFDSQSDQSKVAGQAS